MASPEPKNRRVRTLQNRRSKLAARSSKFKWGWATVMHRSQGMHTLLADPTKPRATAALLRCVLPLSGTTDDDGCTFAPAINPDSERLLGDATNLPPTFAGRQQHYQDAKARRLRELRAELVRRMLD